MTEADFGAKIGEIMDSNQLRQTRRMSGQLRAAVSAAKLDSALDHAGAVDEERDRSLRSSMTVSHVRLCALPARR
jgi:hypothetical protein